MDLLDILNPTRSKFSFTGSYYDTIDQTDPKRGAISIDYKFENPHSTTYKMLFSNVQDFDSTSTAIRTNTSANFKTGSTIVLQDGEAYAIADIAKDYNTAPQQVFRILNASAGIEYVLRLVKIENPWELK